MDDKIISIIREAERKSAKDEIPAIPHETGELLRLLTMLLSSIRGKITALEVGTAYGYSTLWILRGILEGSKKGIIYTIEKRKSRMEIANNFFEKSGYKDMIVTYCGDAKKIIDKLEVNFDFVFLDGTKSEYGYLAKKLYPKITEGGVLTAHNVVKYWPIDDFLAEINDRSRWNTIVIYIDPEGLSISYKLGKNGEK